jgi:glutaredoxin-related protein
LVNIAVVDAGANLKAFLRMDESFLGITNSKHEKYNKFHPDKHLAVNKNKFRSNL